MAARHTYTEAKDCIVAVARRLDSYITDNGLSEVEVAKSIGIDRSVVRRLREIALMCETHVDKNIVVSINYKIHFDSIYLIAKFFGLAISDLVGD